MIYRSSESFVECDNVVEKKSNPVPIFDIRCYLFFFPTLALLTPSFLTCFFFSYRLLTIGNSGVGKTCLLLRYANDSFSPTFITTIGE